MRANARIDRSSIASLAMKDGKETKNLGAAAVDNQAMPVRVDASLVSSVEKMGCSCDEVTAVS